MKDMNDGFISHRMELCELSKIQKFAFFSSKNAHKNAKKDANEAI
jgi:hypothetical protein